MPLFTRPRHDAPTPDTVIAAGVFAATLLLRWLTLDFDNDYFMHLAWAAEMLRGDWPVRDFVEPGFIGQTLLAWAGFQLGGYQLLVEGLIACAFIAAGAALVYAASRHLGVPRSFALAGAALAVATFPRLYAYPKAFVYAAAIWAIARYARDPGWRRLTVLSTITAAAFLFRHDHGVWIAGAVGLALILTLRSPRLIPAAAVYGGLAAALAAPWLVWVALSGQAELYFAFLSGQGGGLVSNRRLPDRTFEVDREAPLVTLAPVEYPRVGIRWAEGAAGQRAEIESRYGLQPIPGAEDRYRLTRPDGATVRALLSDPRIEDTSGIDRGNQRAPAGGFAWLALQLQRYVPPLRLRILPGVIAPANALAWLTWVTFVLPWIVLAVAAGMAVRRRLPWETASIVLPAAALSIVTYQTIVRGSPDSRLGDLGAVTGLLLAWLAWQAWRAAGRARWPARVAAGAAIALTLAAAATHNAIGMRLADAGVDGPTNLVRRAGDVAALYRQRPLDIYAPEDARGLAQVARWLHACTPDDARVAVIGFEPQLFVISQRGIAGGLAFYYLGWNNSHAEQRLTLERWSRQHVPVIVALDYEWTSFAEDYPLIRERIGEQYVPVAHSDFGGSKGMTIFMHVDEQPTGVDAATELPCPTVTAPLLEVARLEQPVDRGPSGVEVIGGRLEPTHLFRLPGAPGSSDERQVAEQQPRG